MQGKPYQTEPSQKRNHAENRRPLASVTIRQGGSTFTMLPRRQLRCLAGMAMEVLRR